MPLAAILAWMLGSFVGRLILGLGIGVVEYIGVDALLSYLASYLASLLSQLPAELLQAWSAFGAAIAIQMLFAAYTTRITLTGLRRVVMGAKAA